MGLFKQGLLDGLNLGPTSTVSGMSPAEGVTVFILAAIASDGHISDAESDMAVSVMKRMKLFRSYSSDVVYRMIEKVFQDFRRYGFEDVVMAAKEAIPYDLHATVFAIVTDLVLADGVLEDEEAEMLDMVHRLLDVPQEVARQLIQSMAIKNKG